jgi:excisionase family DNA binding protein
MNAEPWITLEAVSEHLAVSMDTVRRWIRERDMPAHKAGGVWRFKVSEVDAWVRGSENGGGRASN